MRGSWVLGFRDLGRLGFLPYEHFINVTTDESGMNSGGPDGIVRPITAKHHAEPPKPPP